MNIRTFAWGALLLLAGCGGGGGSPGTCSASAQTCAAIEAGRSGGTPTPPSSTIADAAGRYRGATSSGREATALVLADGTFWLLYATIGDPATIAGAQQGHLMGGGGSFTAGDLIDFGAASPTVASGSATGSYAPRSELAATASVDNHFVGFTGAYDPASSTPASLAAIAGSYTGNGAVVGASERATLTVSNTGVIAGSTAAGCSFTGTALPIAGADLYALTIGFAGAPCANAYGTVSGVATLDAASRRLTGAALNAARTNGFAFAGAKT